MTAPTDERLRKAVEHNDEWIDAAAGMGGNLMFDDTAIQDAADFAEWILEAIKVLRKYEWMGYDEELGEYCFTCHIPKKRGHAPDCALDKLLPK